MAGVYKLGDLFRIGSSKRVLKSQWQSSGVPFYRGREITKLSKDGFVDNDLFISEELFSEYAEKYGVPKEGDIVITAIGTIGNSHIVREQDRFYFKDASVLWLKRNSEVNSGYINWWLKSPIMREQLDEGNGATVDTLTIKKLQTLVVDIPPIPEQKRIVAILDQAFADIEQAHAKTEKNLKNAQELFRNYSLQVFNQRGKGWTEIGLGEIGKVSMCKRILKKQTSGSGDIPFYKIGTFGKTPDAFISKQIYLEFKEKYSFPKKGDILISASGTIGRRVVYDGEPAYFQDSNIVWIDNNESQILNSYLYEFYGVCDWNPSKGATISRLYNDDLRAIKISFPSISQQEKIVTQLVEIGHKTQILQMQYQKKLLALEELRRSLLHNAFLGKLTKDDEIAA